MDLAPEYASIRDLSAAFRRGRLSPVDVLALTLERIERWNPAFNAYISLLPAARHEAEQSERRHRARRPRGPLDGIPVSIKDLLLSTDSLTTAGSRAYGDGLAAEQDAPVVQRLRRAGAVIVGRTNLHEVALGVTSFNEHFGPVRNPWAPDRVAGGSSGGSAAAVAAGLCTVSIGTDTRGSIRIPAACCGITGLKPTRDLVPTAGVIPLSHTLDHVGPMTRSAEDAAILLGVISGKGSRPATWLAAVKKGVRRMPIGLSEYHLRDLDRAVQQRVQDAVRVLEHAGARLREVRLPDLDPAQAASVVITASEAFAFHERTLAERPEGYGPIVRGRLEGGAQWKATDYVRAQQVRDRVMRAFDEVFNEVDVLLGATIPALPPQIDERGAPTVQINGGETGTVDAFTRLNSAQNMGGVPAMSLPCGFSKGVPIGAQLIAGRHQEEHLFAAAGAIQRMTDWHAQRPPLQVKGARGLRDSARRT